MKYRSVGFLVLLQRLQALKKFFKERITDFFLGCEQEVLRFKITNQFKMDTVTTSPSGFVGQVETAVTELLCLNEIGDGVGS